MMKSLRRIFAVVALPVLLVLVWWLFTRTTDSYWVPRPGELAQTFGNVWFGERIMDDVVPSVTRLIIGVAIACALGIFLGIAIGRSVILRRLAEPVLELFRAVPPPVLVPILMVLIGVSDSMQVLVIVSGCIWPVLLNTIEGVRAVDEVLSDTARVYGIEGLSRLRMLTLPAVSPFYLAGIRQALSLGLILMVISEMFASSSGLGFAIVQFQRSFAVPEMWSGIALLGLLGVVLSGIFGLVEKRVLHWYYGLKEVEHSE